ncbi:thioredoxin-like protein [Mycena maculata]|uniref:Thioredoxin-like protein n=1 Tax=Mycena maculata TaxID=230809 RepID=A0AAD7ILL3_9AGAR|nr:thioredoxin-like protein [Mycena maculata]
MTTLQILRRIPRPALRSKLLHSSASNREHYINATKADFDRVVAKGPDDRVVLVDLYADWCGPCHLLSPILRQLTAERKTGSGSNLDLLTVDVENEEKGGFTLSQEFKVRALPTVIAFRGGQRLGEFVGALNEGGVKKFLDKF